MTAFDPDELGSAQRDPVFLDRELAKAAGIASLRTHPRDAEELPPSYNPLQPQRAVLGQRQFEALNALPDYDPLKQPLRRWTYRLLERRINYAQATRTALLRYAAPVTVEQPKHASVTRAELLEQLLADDAHRKSWAFELSRHAEPLFSSVSKLWQRRRELDQRLNLPAAFAPARVIEPLGGFADAGTVRPLPDDVPSASPGVAEPRTGTPAQADSASANLNSNNSAPLPQDPHGSPHRTLPLPDAEQLAERVLQATAELAHEDKQAELHTWVRRSLALNAEQGWPAQLTERQLGAWFRDSKLLLDLPLKPAPLPRPIGAASYVLALARLGHAFRIAAAPEDQPFVIRHDPYELEAHARAWTFSRLLVNPAFVERNLGLTGGKQQDHLRQLSRVYLWRLRILALKVKLMTPALAGAPELEEHFRELCHTTTGLDLNGQLAGSLFRLEVDAPQQLAGACVAELELQALTENHDLDWYRNPRAVDQLRSEAKRAPRTSTTREELNAGVSLLAKQLAAALE